MTGVGTRISGTMLRDLVLCERRVRHDVHADPALRDPVSSFVAMLWAGGSAHEAEVLGALAGEVVDLRQVSAPDRVEATMAAMGGGADWIIGSRLEFDDMVGRPDLLHRVGGRWLAGDVKSGAAGVGDGSAPKLEYGVQVGLYAAMLGHLGKGASDRAFVVGRDGATSWYDLLGPAAGGGVPLTSTVDRLVGEARAIIAGGRVTRPALSSACGLCHWRGVCRAELVGADDVTLVAGLGRSLRDAVEGVAPTVSALAALDVQGLRVAGVGASRLARFRDRARLLRTPGATPYAREPLALSAAPLELHLDLEADPMRDGLVYLHGILVRDRRVGPGRDEFVHFFADDEDGEGAAFAAAFDFLVRDAEAHVFYYSKFERTAYRALQRRHPEVCSADDVEGLFSPRRSTDLFFDVVAPRTEWPLSSIGIKPIAKHLGFAWRDADASGAASIAWYDEYRRAGDAALRDRIVDYNHDDCRATAVLLDALREMPVRGVPPWPPVEGRMPALGR